MIRISYVCIICSRYIDDAGGPSDDIAVNASNTVPIVPIASGTSIIAVDAKPFSRVHVSHLPAGKLPKLASVFILCIKFQVFIKIT